MSIAKDAVFVSEMADDSLEFWLGLFECSWQQQRPPGAPPETPLAFFRGPEAVPLEPALAWAHEHSDIVILRVGTKEWSAGRTRDPALPEWPRDMLPARRPLGEG